MLNLAGSSVWTRGALYLVARLALAPFSPVPGAVPLDPLLLFVSTGPPPRRSGLALLPGLVAGDVLAGLPIWAAGVRILGLLWILWTQPEADFHHRFARYATPLALWSALPIAWPGMYPLPYLVIVHLVQDLFWWGIGVPQTGGGPAKPWIPVLAFPAALVLLQVFWGPPEVWPPPGLGTRSPLGLLAAATLLALLPVGIRGMKAWRTRKYRKKQAVWPKKDPGSSKKVH